MENKLPQISTPLPGPEALKILALDKQYVSPSYTRDYPMVAKRGQGAIVEDVDGNLFLDFSAGIAVVSTGHCHPDIVRVIQKQAETLIHMSGTDFYYPLLAQLAEKMARITPGTFPKRVAFGNSGAEAMEAAMKIARYHTKRQRFIAFSARSTDGRSGRFRSRPARLCSGAVSGLFCRVSCMCRMPILIAARKATARRSACAIASAPI